jgi:hypothetical protein
MSSATSAGNKCYHAGMSKQQIGARVDADIADLAKKRAADRGLSVGDYLAQLVLDDTSAIRARAMGAAQEFLANFQEAFDAAEQGQSGSPSGTRAA